MYVDTCAVPRTFLRWRPTDLPRRFFCTFEWEKKSVKVVVCIKCCQKHREASKKEDRGTTSTGPDHTSSQFYQLTCESTATHWHLWSRGTSLDLWRVRRRPGKCESWQTQKKRTRRVAKETSANSTQQKIKPHDLEGELSDVKRRSWTVGLWRVRWDRPSFDPERER